MRITIRSKLIFSISLLMVVVFSLAAYLFISEKKSELADDIYFNSLAFSKLTAPTVVELHDLYLTQNSFVYFNREIQKVFGQNDDIDGIMLVNFGGEILYDSGSDLDKVYDGSVRMVEDQEFLKQIQSENLSVKLKNNEAVFIEEDDETNPGGFEKGTLVDYFVVPVTEQYSVVYSVNYHNLDERIVAMVRRIVYLALFAVILGMILAFWMSSNVTRPIEKLVEAAGGVAKGDLSTRVDIKTRDEMNFLGKAFNKMAIDLEESLEAKIYKERVAHELKIASDIQDRIIPDEVPVVEGLDIAAGIIPAEEMGGDMYDFLPITNDRLLMYLGDVTGHGIPAGIVSSIASALFYGYGTDLFVGKQDSDLYRIIVNVNKVLKVKTMANMFMTLCLMEWDKKERVFSYMSAGHEPIMHYKAEERIVEMLPGGGVALGMIDDVSKHLIAERVDLQRGDFLVVYSDGIPEAWKSKTEAYGIDRFKKAVASFGNLESAEAIKKAILSDVEQFVGGYKQMDDVTLIVIKRI